MILQPPYLKKGDTIGVVCPSGYMPYENMETCLNTLIEWGFVIKKGKTLGTHFNYFSGTDAERLADMQSMLDDETVSAVLCARGGYGLSRIIDDLDFSSFLKKPKWIIGYSDVTVLHAHIFSQFGIASLHSPMAGAFNDGGSNDEFIQSMKYALLGERMEYRCTTNHYNKSGVAEGELIGGNLSLLAHLIGSKSSINTTGKLLFLEDIGEYIYHIDRLLIQLKRADLLTNLAGLVIGSFTDMKDTVIPFGESVYDAIYDKVKEYSYPVCFQFPVGHTPINYALKHGVTHRLVVQEHEVLLTEKR